MSPDISKEVQDTHSHFSARLSRQEFIRLVILSIKAAFLAACQPEMKYLFPPDEIRRQLRWRSIPANQQTGTPGSFQLAGVEGHDILEVEYRDETEAVGFGNSITYRFEERQQDPERPTRYFFLIPASMDEIGSSTPLTPVRFRIIPADERENKVIRHPFPNDELDSIKPWGYFDWDFEITLIP